MYAKLVVLTVALGVIACSLLALRQLRLQAVHDLAQVQRRLAEHDRTLWQMRVNIASRVAPGRIERLAASLGDLEPIIPQQSTAGAPAVQLAVLDRGADPAQRRPDSPSGADRQPDPPARSR